MPFYSNLDELNSSWTDFIVSPPVKKKKQKKYPTPKNPDKLHEWLQENGFMTGSTAFFGEGNDIDYVVLEKDLQGLDHSIEVTTNPNYPTSGSYKFKDGDDIINIIILDKEADVSAWRYATRMMSMHLNLCTEQSYDLIQSDKGFRVRSFKHFLDVYKQGVPSSPDKELSRKSRKYPPMSSEPVSDAFGRVRIPPEGYLHTPGSVQREEFVDPVTGRRTMREYTYMGSGRTHLTTYTLADDGEIVTTQEEVRGA